MAALHIMTYNVQILPWLAQSVFQGQTNDAEARADRIADDILALPPSERPDVIVFNEMFDEDGRSRLLQRLQGTWKHFVKKMHDNFTEDDSGLMVFSRFAFQTLPTGGKLFERFYADSADDDAHASKGVGVVRIDTPVSLTTIAFTHTQGAYASDDEYRDIRAKQLDTVHAVLTEILGGSPELWSRVIVLGDLNIRGDPAATTNEWAATFDPPSGGASSTKLGGPMLDGWRRYMHPPGVDPGPDPGISCIDFETGTRRRLDYMCFARPEVHNRVLVPQHMFMRMRNGSDHFALEAIVQQASSHCTPADAIDFLALPASATSPGTPSSVRFSPVNFVHAGSYQWLFVKQPGTYTINHSPNTEVRLYAHDDLSRPLERLDTTVVQELPPNLQGVYDAGSVEPKGQTFVCRTPFFIAARHVQGDMSTGVVSLLEHRGESAATAIHLPVHRSVLSTFPLGQKLGSDDMCWFKAWLPPTFAGTPRPESFTVVNPTDGKIHVMLRDTPDHSVAKVSGETGALQLTHETTGAQFIYLTIERSSDQIAGFKARWISRVSYLLLDEPIGLYVDDESGIDRPGADEPEIQINVDGDPFALFAGTWDDADTGERWPGLDVAMRQRANMRLPGAKRIGFIDAISISYVEPDMDAQGWLNVEVKALSRSEPETAERRIGMPVPDMVKAGQYTFYCTVTKIP